MGRHRLRFWLPILRDSFRKGSPSLQAFAMDQGWVEHQTAQMQKSRADAATSWRRTEPVEEAAQRWRARSPAWPSDLARAEGGAGNSNIVPFSGRSRQLKPSQLPRRHPWSKHNFDEPSGVLLDAAIDRRKVVLMFDLNGCLTTHTAKRRSTGAHKARPGIHHLRRLQNAFHIGLYSSASAKTVATAVRLLSEAAGPGEPLFDHRLALCRTHTFLAPETHVAAGNKHWDTCKPLRPYFSRLHRVLLVDDDAHKAVPGEEKNMVLMPVWENDDPADGMVERLVDVLLDLAERLGEDPEADVRTLTVHASQQLAAAAAKEAQQRSQTSPSANHSGGAGMLLPVG